MKKLYEGSSNNSSYGADAGEPDTGWLPGGDTRTLGFEDGKPEPWFDQLEFEQVDFPVADFIFGSKRLDKKLGVSVKKKMPITNLDAVLKSIDADLDELTTNTKRMYKDIVRR